MKKIKFIFILLIFSCSNVQVEQAYDEYDYTDSAEIVIGKIIEQINMINDCVEMDTTLNQIINLQERIKNGEIKQDELLRIINRYNNSDSVIMFFEEQYTIIQKKNNTLKRDNKKLKQQIKLKDRKIKEHIIKIDNRAKFLNTNFSCYSKKGKITNKASKVDYILAEFTIEEGKLKNQGTVTIVLTIQNIMTGKDKVVVKKINYLKDNYSTIKYDVSDKMKSGNRLITLTIAGNDTINYNLKLK